MNNKLLRVSLRQNALYIPSNARVVEAQKLTEPTLGLVANAARLGYGFSESALHAVNGTGPDVKLSILETLKDVTGMGKNWTPLIKAWDVPTGESRWDHFVTSLANLLGVKQKGTELVCGHFIPDNTFPLERYNGCPFCGTPFEFGAIEHLGQGSKLTILEVFDETDMQSALSDLLTSKSALDATQVDSLKILLQHFPLPEVRIEMKETTMLVIDHLVEQGRDAEIQRLFRSPNDILRYLWFKHTDLLQIVEPKTLVRRMASNHRNHVVSRDNSAAALIKAKTGLKLKYSRTQGKQVAKWLNNLEMNVKTSCEVMHPKRNMWVRFIRALRLAEFSKRKGYEKLAELLDAFYNQNYDVVQGRINSFRLKSDAENTFALLKARPGLFARSLFSNMLWFGPDITLSHFREVIDEVPARLILSLNAYADIYFDKKGQRSVKPLGGVNKLIPVNQYLKLYSDKDLEAIKEKVEDLCIEVIQKRFANTKAEGKTLYVEETLYKMPLSIGDRAETIQDQASASMGCRFPVQGSVVRLFLQWGVGLKAQHLDMDLSCNVVYESREEYCSYMNLTIPGCQHSGDIQSIPNQVGTAEYIDVDVDYLQRVGARYVSFTCNAYTNGSLSPNLVVGWMDSKYSMKISRKTGVAYDPSCVQHQVRIGKTISKGLLFGVLDVQKRELIWLEMSFSGQVTQRLNAKGVEALMAKLESKMNIGALLDIKAEAQGLEFVEDKSEADEVYDMQWAVNTAQVTRLFVD
ncbi:MAG: TerD family protein [Bacteroidia bacterium]|nr:TerD family protein [Bacteroidia bacterium]